MKITEIREMSVDELERKVVDLKNELMNLRFQNSTKQLENPRRIQVVRKDIARIKTIINQKRVSVA